MSTAGKRAQIAAVWLVSASLLHAAIPGDGDPILEPIVDAFKNATDQWRGIVVTAAMSLFALLAAIDFLWMAALCLIRHSGFQDFVAEFVRRTMFYGFFWALLTYSGDWAKRITDSFTQLGSQGIQVATAGIAMPTGGFYVTDTLSPDGIAKHGMNVAFRICESVPSGLEGFSVGILFYFGAACVVGLFSLMAIRQVLILAEMYICLSAGTIVLGLGGSRWTKDYAVNYYKYTVSVGVKLMFIQFTVAIALSFMNSLLIGVTTFDVREILVMLCALVVLTALMWAIPAIAMQFLQGVSHSSGNEVLTAAKMMTTAAQTMAVAATAGTAAVANATKLAMAQKAASSRGSGGDRLGSMFSRAAGAPGAAGSGGGAGGGGTKRFAAGMKKPLGAALSLAGATGRNLGKATVAAALSSSASGRPLGQAVNQHLLEERAKLEETK